MRITVVGPGLIGRSVTLAARRAHPGAEIVEIDRDESLERAAGSDVIVLATPIDVTLSLLRDHAALLDQSVTIDTGSTKKSIVTAARDAGLVRFVGGHPMAGGAVSGPDGAREDLFDGRLWFVVPHGAQHDAVSSALAFVRSLGAKPFLMDDDGAEHDRAMAVVSHLPQVVATTLMAVAGDVAGQRLAWAGNGLKDTTRLAQSDLSVWQSILATNADELRPLVRYLAAELQTLSDNLENETHLNVLFAKAKQYRGLL